MFGTPANRREITEEDNERMLKLWREGKDTLDIARALGVPEHVVYARLPMLRQIEAFQKARA